MNQWNAFGWKGEYTGLTQPSLSKKFFHFFSLRKINADEIQKEGRTVWRTEIYWKWRKRGINASKRQQTEESQKTLFRETHYNIKAHCTANCDLFFFTGCYL